MEASIFSEIIGILHLVTMKLGLKKTTYPFKKKKKKGISHLSFLENTEGVISKIYKMKINKTFLKNWRMGKRKMVFIINLTKS